MNKTPLSIIFLIVVIDLLGFGIIIPILPLYAQHGFGSSDFTVGLLVSSFSFMQFLFTPIWGRLSDRIGRKPVLAISLACSVAGYMLFGFADSLAMLFIARLLGGVGGGNVSAAQAYIADVTTDENRATGMGLIGAAFGLGFVFGPFMGGMLSEYGYDVPGFAAAGLSLLALITTITLLPESLRNDITARKVKTQISFASLRMALKRPKIGPLLILFFLVTFGFANIYATFPIISSREFGYSDRQVGYLFAYIGLIGVLTQGGLIRIFMKLWTERILFHIGVALLMVGLSLIPFYVSTSILLIVLSVMSLGSGMVTPTCLSMISQSADAHEQGGILGINQSLSALGRILGPVWGAYVFQAFGHSWPFLTGGVVMLVVLILAWRML